MLILVFCAISLVAGEVHRGRYPGVTGQDIQYYIDNSDRFATVLVDMMDQLFNDPMVNVTYNKNNGGIRFHILGNDHIDSIEEDYEEEAALTRELMETGLGKSLPGLSKYVYDEHKVSGKENEAMMLLHQLALFSHTFHDGAHTAPITKRRQKRNVLSNILGGNNGHEESNDVRGLFPESIVRICNGNNIGSHGGCTVDLAVEGYSGNECARKEYFATEPKELLPHKFSERAIAGGCYGLCGPWCVCWAQVCEDCCWHQGCYKHDKYCDKPKSLECRFGKGVVYGRNGLHIC